MSFYAPPSSYSLCFDYFAVREERCSALSTARVLGYKFITLQHVVDSLSRKIKSLTPSTFLKPVYFPTSKAEVEGICSWLYPKTQYNTCSRVFCEEQTLNFKEFFFFFLLTYLPGCTTSANSDIHINKHQNAKQVDMLF